MSALEPSYYKSFRSQRSPTSSASVSDSGGNEGPDPRLSVKPRQQILEGNEAKSRTSSLSSDSRDNDGSFTNQQAQRSSDSDNQHYIGTGNKLIRKRKVGTEGNQQTSKDKASQSSTVQSGPSIEVPAEGQWGRAGWPVAMAQIIR